MRFSEFQSHFSVSRTNRYLFACSSNTQRAMRLYQRNLRLAQAFHPLLSSFEVVLRNKIRTVLDAYFSNTDWIIHEQTGFMISPRLTRHGRADRYILTEVQKARQKLTRRHRPLTAENIVAEQTLGFWVALFDDNYFGVLSASPMRVFSHLARPNRATVFANLRRVRDFRNRINHGEPICFNGALTDFAEAVQVRDLVLDMSGWMSPRTRQWIEQLDNGTINRQIRLATSI